MNNVAQRRTLEKLYRDHKDHVYNYLTRLTSDRELAADITQQTFLKLLGDPNLETLQTPKAYIFTVARNALYDEWKRKKERLLRDGEDDQIEAMPDDPLEAPANKAEQQDMQDKVEQAITLMRPKFRELMLLRYTEDLSVEEIADITGRTVNDVKVNLHRARLSFDKDFTYLMYSRAAKSRERCDTIGDLLTPLSDQELPREQIEVVAKHISHCQVCARDMEEMKRDRKLFTAIPLIPAPMAFDQLVPHSATAEAVRHTSNVAVKTVATKAVAVKLLAGIVVAALVAMAGYFVLRPHSVDAPIASIAPPAQNITPPLPPTVNTTVPITDPVAAPTVKPNVDVAKPESSVKPAKEKTKVKGFYYDGPPYVAEQVEYSTTGDTERSTNKTYMSAKGSRGEIMMGKDKIIMIANFASKKYWAVNPGKKIYLEDSVDDNGNAQGELKALSAGSTENMTVQGVGQPTPCGGYAVKRQLGEEVVLGRSTQKWQCNNGKGTTGVIEWFDPKIKMTVRSDAGGQIQELREIKFGELPANLFELPSGYQKVGFQELFGIPASMIPGNQ